MEQRGYFPVAAGLRILSVLAFSLPALAAFAEAPAVPPAAPAQTASPPAAAPALPEIKKTGNIYSFTLANGLQVVVIPNHRAPVVTNMIWYRAGSADEPYGRTGIAHFLEHLMFKGTKNYSGGEFTDFVSRIGGEENAFTSYDYTAYYEIVAAPYLKDMMRREADRMENLLLTDAVIAPERQVIIEERRMRTDNDPAAMLGEEARATVFLNSPYHNPVIGWKQEMEQLGRKDALDFYGKFYTPNNAIAVLAGDIDPETARSLAAETYGRLKPRAPTPACIRPQEPVSRTLREVTMRDARVAEPSFQVYRLVPSYHNAKNPKEAAALDLLASILGGDSESRLYQNLAVKKGIAASVSAVYDGMALDDGLFYVQGVPRGGADIETLRRAADAEIAAIAKNGVSQDELKRARRRFNKEFIFAQDNPTGFAQLYGAALTTGLSIEDVNSWTKRLENISSADIKAVAARYLGADKGVISRLLPLNAETAKKAAQVGGAGALGEAARRPVR